MKFREHRGQLSDSMATQVEVNSMQELLDTINKGYGSFGVKFDEVKFDYAGFDKRINQETYYVSIFSDNSWCCIGMSDSDKFEIQ